MLSLLVLITTAECGNGSTKLTIRDFLAVSDFPGNRRIALGHQHHVLAALAFGLFRPAALAVGQQKEISFRSEYEEQI